MLSIYMSGVDDMNFRDVRSQGELLCNLSGEIHGNNLKITWTWPMGTSKIIIVMVPEEEDFNEVAYDSYRKVSVYASENKNYFIDTLDLASRTRYKYYLFTCDSSDDNLLIRQYQQSNPVHSPGFSALVKYCLSKTKDKAVLSRFIKKDKNDTYELKILSNSDLNIKDLYYRFVSMDEKTEGFCFPCPIKKNQYTIFQDIELPQNQTLQIYSNKDSLKIVKVEEL